MKKRIRERKLPHSFVRLLPKETGVRPIVNLSRKSEGTKSINQILQATFRILQYEKVRSWCYWHIPEIDESPTHFSTNQMYLDETAESIGCDRLESFRNVHKDESIQGIPENWWSKDRVSEQVS